LIIKENTVFQAIERVCRGAIAVKTGAGSQK